MNCTITLLMLEFRCCLQACCNLRWFKTSGSNFWKPTDCPSCQNIKFFVKSGYGQASIRHKSPLTTPTIHPTPLLCMTSVLALEMACAAFNTIKYITIFYFGFKKQQHLQSGAVMGYQRNGQERSAILGLLACASKISGLKEYIFLVPRVGTHFFLPIYPLHYCYYFWCFGVWV